MKESQIIYRWYNFHFSSITTEARLSPGAPRSPALGKEARAGRTPAAASPARPTGRPPRRAPEGGESGRSRAPKLRDLR